MEFRIYQRKKIFRSGRIAIVHGLKQPGNFSGTGIHPLSPVLAWYSECSRCVIPIAEKGSRDGH
jgi:hypothetical protein